MDRRGALITPLVEPESPLRLQGHNMNCINIVKPLVQRIASNKTKILFII